MVSLERFQELADEIADEIPEEFYRELNGGIVLLERSKLHEQSRPEAPLYIMGEFTRSRMMGRHILLYYGSFAAVYSALDEEALRRELRRVMLHEFTHHLESLSGVRTLEEKDARRLAQYKSKFKSD